MSQTTELLLRIRQQGGEQLTRLSGSFKNLGQQAAAANVNFKEVSDELRKIQQTSANSINNLKGYANAWREIANSVEIGTAEFKQANAEAAKLDAQLRKVQPGGRGRFAAGAQIAGTIAGAGVFGGLEGAAGAGIGAIVGGVPGAITGGAIGAQVGMFRQGLGDVATYAAELNKQRQALRLVTKDSFEYQRALSFITQTSRDLAIPQEIITRQFTQLTASVKGAGGNVRDAEKAFIGVASGIRGTGGSLEQLDSALTATSQVFSKGKVSAEELRQQIGERLPGAFSLFAKAVGMTPQQLDKALEKGQVSLQDFQLFAEKLFLEYGESAKILADGPDAAGDRLKTQLAELKAAIGPTLKDMGASFQNFASEAIKSFLSLGKELERFGRLMEEKLGGKLLDNAIRNVKAQDAIIKQLEAEQLVRVGGLSKEEKSRLSLARALRAGSMQIIQGAKAGPQAPMPEKPSNLPGIDTTGGGDSKSILNKLQSDFSRSIAVLGRQFNNEARKRLLNDALIIENQISAAIKKGNKEEVERLKIMQQRKALEITRNVLINEETALEDKIFEGKSKGLDVTNAQIRLDAIRLEREQAVLALLQLENQEESKKQGKLRQEMQARFDINVAIANAQLGSKVLTEEDQKRVQINQYLSQVIEKYAGILSSEELLEAIRKIREAMEGTAKATGSFGEKVAKSFADVVKSSGDLANNLGATLGNAFNGLGDQLADFVTTGKMQFADFARSVLNDLAKIFVRFALFQTLKALIPGGSGLAKAFGFASGGIMTQQGPLQLRRYAAGGIASSPQMAIYGEGSRPEAYVPLPDGRSIPVTMKGGSEMGSVVVNVDASGSSVEGNNGQANQLGKVIGAAVQAELIKQRRPGGLLA
jgi:lambda family phage tail tape measure protein